jgi:hypothetical protein
VRAVLTLTAAIAIGLLAPSSGTAATFKVNCAKKNLQNRINAVPAGSVLLVTGTCKPVTIDKTITLDGNPSATIDANDVGRPVTINGSPTIRLTDLRLVDGRVTGGIALGGGILHAGGTLTLRRVTIAENVVEASGGVATTALGGGIYSQGGAVRLIGCSVRGNVARALTGSAGAGGGGIAKTGTLILEGTRVTGNRSRAETATGNANASGGGIVAGGSVLKITSSHVDGNFATAVGTGPATGANAVGGAIEVSAVTTLTIAGSTLSSNRAVSTLVGGTAFSEGGAINGFTQGGSIRNSVLNGNHARSTSSGSATVQAVGGGMYMETTNGLTILRSRVTNGRVVATTGGMATATGGGLSLAAGPFTVKRTLIAGNELDANGTGVSASAVAGGLHVRSSSVVQLVESTVRANRADSTGAGADSSGGGVAVSFSTLNVRASTLSKNVAGTSGQALGGGIFATGGGPHTVFNSTISGNRANGATARGGGIDTDTTLAITAATIARNSAKIGGGIYVEGGTTTLRASLLGLNTAPDGPNCSQNVASAGRNLLASTTGCAFTPMATDRTGLAPKLGLLRSNGGPTQTIALLAGSPALNRIPKAECASGRDQRGVRRPQPKTGRCDIGAYERRP